jgi:hypothetical protein
MVRKDSAVESKLDFVFKNITVRFCLILYSAHAASEPHDIVSPR